MPEHVLPGDMLTFTHNGQEYALSSIKRLPAAAAAAAAPAQEHAPVDAPVAHPPPTQGE